MFCHSHYTLFNLSCLITKNWVNAEYKVKCTNIFLEYEAQFYLVEVKPYTNIIYTIYYVIENRFTLLKVLNGNHTLPTNLQTFITSYKDFINEAVNSNYDEIDLMNLYFKLYPAIKTKKLISCPTNYCIGEIKNSKCDKCLKEICQLCYKTIETIIPHVCNPTDIAELIAYKEGKNCPMCNYFIPNITKSKRMFCTMCKCAFLWETREVLINPQEIFYRSIHEGNIYKTPDIKNKFFPLLKTYNLHTNYILLNSILLLDIYKYKNHDPSDGTRLLTSRMKYASKRIHVDSFKLILLNIYTRYYYISEYNYLIHSLYLQLSDIFTELINKLSKNSTDKNIIKLAKKKLAVMAETFNIKVKLYNTFSNDNVPTINICFRETPLYYGKNTVIKSNNLTTISKYYPTTYYDYNSLFSIYERTNMCDIPLHLMFSAYEELRKLYITDNSLIYFPQEHAVGGIFYNYAYLLKYCLNKLDKRLTNLDLILLVNIPYLIGQKYLDEIKNDSTEYKLLLLLLKMNIIECFHTEISINMTLPGLRVFIIDNIRNIKAFLYYCFEYNKEEFKKITKKNNITIPKYLYLCESPEINILYLYHHYNQIAMLLPLLRDMLINS